MANLPELKIHFRECNATSVNIFIDNLERKKNKENSNVFFVFQVIAEYTKLPSDTVRIQFTETSDNADYITSIKELQDIVSAIRVTSCLLLPLIMNEDEDNILAAKTSGKKKNE